MILRVFIGKATVPYEKQLPKIALNLIRVTETVRAILEFAVDKANGDSCKKSNNAGNVVIFN